MPIERLSRPWICSTCRHQRAFISLCPRRQPFATSSLRRAGEPSLSDNDTAPSKTPDNSNYTPLRPGQSLFDLGRDLGSQQKQPHYAREASMRAAGIRNREDNMGYPQSSSNRGSGLLENLPQSKTQNFSQDLQNMVEHHHLHVYATKHNTHLTLTSITRDPILSLSAGNIGFRKAARGTYDAAYQLAAYTLRTMQEKGHLGKIGGLEVVLRGFGPGREAVTKVLLGAEGRYVRGKILKVTDGTRLKFGGTRSPKPRRLG